MIGAMSRIITIILQLLLFLAPFEVHADYGYGNSCSAVPNSSPDSDLSRNTAYGHIMLNLDMTKYTGKDSCNPANKLFRFCLRNKSGTPTCTALNLGDSKKLAELSHNPNLGGNPLLKDIRLTVTKLSDLMFLTMPTSRGPKPLACKKTNTNTPPLSQAPQLQEFLPAVR
jgi:type IV secretion system protein VirB6